MEGGEVHLIPDALDVGDGGAFEEPGEVLLDDPRAGIASGGYAEAHGAVGSLELDDQGAQYIDAEALPRLPVRGVLRHGRGDVIVDPVALGLVVVVSAAAPGDIGPNGADGGYRHSVVLLLISGPPRFGPAGGRDVGSPGSA